MVQGHVAHPLLFWLQHISSFVEWLIGQLRRPSHPSKSVPTVTGVLSVLLKERWVARPCCVPAYVLVRGCACNACSLSTMLQVGGRVSHLHALIGVSADTGLDAVGVFLGPSLQTHTNTGCVTPSDMTCHAIHAYSSTKGASARRDTALMIGLFVACRGSRILFLRSGGIGVLPPLLRALNQSPNNSQLLYELVLCIWQLSFLKEAALALGGAGMDLCMLCM